jgi:hypothetical protein
MGDVTAWCVFNDSVPAEERTTSYPTSPEFTSQNPMGIEIKQSVFAYSPENFPELANVVFIRYNLENKGTVNSQFDSVYFSTWSDPDLGDYIDDLISCDTTLNSSICYNENDDSEYGSNPPAFFTTLLQGPPVYLPGLTYTDNNQNNIYDLGDTPLDSALINLGTQLGTDYIEGATNLDITSHKGFLKSHPVHHDPGNPQELRYAMLCRDLNGLLFDPCTWEFGEVVGEDCNLVNPLFMYSGDPVENKGWINIFGTDQRLMMNTGPFDLEVGKPVDIIYAYIVGRGNDALNSITEGRKIVKDVRGFYSTNFTDIPVGVGSSEIAHIPSEFVLEQNYPNPFNPVTTIQYSIPAGVNSELPAPTQSR